MKDLRTRVCMCALGLYRLPPNPDGEWWEMIDESSGLPYYHHTKTGDTTWERPHAFVIPLGILQVRKIPSRFIAHLLMTC